MDWYFETALDLYSRGAWFESQDIATLTLPLLFCCPLSQMSRPQLRYSHLYFSMNSIICETHVYLIISLFLVRFRILHSTVLSMK
jgi:hypothetical protein